MKIDGDDPQLNCYNQMIIAHWCIKYKVLSSQKICTDFARPEQTTLTVEKHSIIFTDWPFQVVSGRQREGKKQARNNRKLVSIS